MTIRTPVGQRPVRRAHPRVPAVLVVVALVLALGIGLNGGRLPETMAEGEPAPTDPAATIEPVPTEPPPILEPTATTTPAEAPPPEVPVSVPSETPEPTPVEKPPAEPIAAEDPTPTPVSTPTEEPTVDQPATFPPAAAEFSTAAGDACAPAPGSSNAIAPGGAGVYSCVATITAAPVPMSFTDIDLEWTITAGVTSGWTVDLRAQDDAGTGDDQAWTPGAAPGLVVVADLTSGDDADGNQTDETFTYTIHFGIRLTVPLCGGPTNPTVTVTASAVPTIDTVPGTRSQDQPIQPIQPTLAVTAPMPTLSRGTTGALDDPDTPLRSSHMDQVVDVGTMHLTVTSGYCGGWNVSIKATDFVPAAGGVAFGAANLAVTGIDAGQGAPVSDAPSLLLSNAPQSVVSAPNQSLAAGAYTYSLDLALTVPGGTPPGTYTSTVTVTTSAAP